MAACLCVRVLGGLRRAPVQCRGHWGARRCNGGREARGGGERAGRRPLLECWGLPMCSTDRRWGAARAWRPFRAPQFPMRAHLELAGLIAPPSAAIARWAVEARPALHGAAPAGDPSLPSPLKRGSAHPAPPRRQAGNAAGLRVRHSGTPTVWLAGGPTSPLGFLAPPAGPRRCDHAQAASQTPCASPPARRARLHRRSGGAGGAGHPHRLDRRARNA